jgi:hypothetical protein
MARETRKAVEERLDEWNARPHLETLVDAGCDRAEIIAALNVLGARFADDSWEHLTGLKLKPLKSAVKRFRNCADAIDSLNSRPLMWAAIVYGIKHNPDFYNIPRMLRLYADMLEFEIKNSGPKKHPLLNICKALLVDMAQRCGGPHDKEVAGLIGAVLGREYDTKSHSEWRANHEALLDRVRLLGDMPQIPLQPSVTQN